MKYLAVFITLLALMLGASMLATTGSNNLIFQFVHWLPYGDKLGHFILFGCLTSVSHLMTRCYSITLVGKSLPVVYLPLFAYAIIDELLQIGTANRSFDLWDLAMGLLGIVVFGEITKRRCMANI